jgi:hypothetical protein
MSALPQDDELSALLNDLDDVDSAVKIISKPIKQPKKSTTTEDESSEIDEDVPEHQPDPEPPTESEPGSDMEELYSNSIHELLGNYRKDRKDVDKLIKFLWDKLGKSEPSRVLFETLAISLRTKSETNTNLLKLIDVVGKKLDKSKSSMGDFDLESLLDG